MIEQVLNRRNMMRAYRQVVSNKGSAGIDGMAVTELYAHLTKNRAQLESDVRAGKYQPQSILGVEIVNRKMKCSDFGKMTYSIFGNSQCSDFGNNSTVTLEQK